MKNWPHDVPIFSVCLRPQIRKAPSGVLRKAEGRFELMERRRKRRWAATGRIRLAPRRFAQGRIFAEIRN
jgi:hypothetical protein